MAQLRDKSERNFRIVNTGSNESGSLSFNKIKVGRSTLSDDVSLDLDAAAKILGSLRLGGRKRLRREDVEKALEVNDVNYLSNLSRRFYNTSGIYSRLCRYMAYLFRYDWFLTPLMSDSVINGGSEGQRKKIVKDWYLASAYLERCSLKELFGELALKVIRDGCYYGYVVNQNDGMILQDLPIGYCRSRYALNGKPAVEFNVRYFDDAFSDVAYRVRVLKMWPKEVQKAYLAYKNGTLPKDFSGDEIGWFLLDPSKAVKFNLSGSDAPLFATVMPKIMDLNDAQDLDKKKMLQQILKIIIQKMPIDKNGDLIFDVSEAQQLHANAVAMLGDAVGVDVLTTFADVKVADMADNSAVSSVDQLDKVERTVYNEAGTGKNLFNAEGNLALEKSIANDEATMSSLIRQFESFANSLLSQFNRNPRRVTYEVQILPTTVYNYKDMAKSYKELATLGFSKLLPQVALGQSQSSVIMTAYFENDFMDLADVFEPLKSSNTMSGSDSGSTGGRPPLADDEKSDKTIQNMESEG